jgi:hypothetical protein
MGSLERSKSMNAFSPSLEVGGLLATPPTLSVAANEEFARSEPSAGGWDPYEVWRTRIKAAQDNLKTGDILAHIQRRPLREPT